jgi:hypothetical protein
LDLLALPSLEPRASLALPVLVFLREGKAMKMRSLLCWLFGHRLNVIRQGFMIDRGNTNWGWDYIECDRCGWRSDRS